MISRYILAGALWLPLSVPAFAAPRPGFEERIQVVRSVEDPDVTPDLARCAAASFTPNVVLAASLSSIESAAFDGRVIPRKGRRVGTGTACARITSVSVGAIVPFVAEFKIGRDTLVGEGECRITSSTVPVSGLILAACIVPLDSGRGTLGGVATSNSVLNPFGLPGFDTGSVWTLHVFDEKGTGIGRRGGDPRDRE